jgi:hypothetical protein
MTRQGLLILFALFMLQGGAQAQQANPEAELNLNLIHERIAKTSAEGLGVIGKVKQMRPQIQKYLAAKSLGAIVEDYSSGRGPFFIHLIGWDAVESSAGRWAVSLYYQDEEKKLIKATWEYNTGKNVLFPGELNYATKFWAKGGSGSTRP